MNGSERGSLSTPDLIIIIYNSGNNILKSGYADEELKNLPRKNM